MMCLDTTKIFVVFHLLRLCKVTLNHLFLFHILQILLGRECINQNLFIFSAAGVMCRVVALEVFPYFITLQIIMSLVTRKPVFGVCDQVRH